MKKDYTIGLDIGVASVGWAVLRDDYDLVKKRMKILGDSEKNNVKKNFWGVRLFDEGKTAENKRTKRIARRRYTRRYNRINYLREIFAEEISCVDMPFFDRLDESFLIENEKVFSKYPIFGTLEEEKKYHTLYPTIYHLRKKLVDSNEKEDIRLIYLAMAHIVKYRGHFLIEGKLSTENSSIDKTFQTFLTTYNQQFTEQVDGTSINRVEEDISVENLFNQNFSRSKKAENVLTLFKGEKSNGTFSQFIKLIAGNQGNFKKTFGLVDDFKLQFSKEDYEESVENLLVEVGDEFADVFIAAKRVYDAVELSSILKTENEATRAKLSSSMVERYENHRIILVELKDFFKENLPSEYYNMFKNNKKNGYAGYIESGVSQEDFYKYTKKVLGKVSGSEKFFDLIEKEDFLRKQRTFDNGVIPHQIHLEELKLIIDNQKQYYPFLDQNKDKIEKIVTFRIPYYVGPLANGNSQFSWLERNSFEKITPYNLEEVVDINKSAIGFIERMTNYDVYLPMEKVLPKNSWLYQKYMIFNELTKVSYINDQGNKLNFSSKEKLHIFDALFKENRKVTKKALENFLKNEYLIESPTIIGIESAFNASFSVYHDFKKMEIPLEILNNPDNESIFEEVIKILTIFEDRKMIREQLESYKILFSSSTLKKMERRHYTGWGRLSKKLINGIKDENSDKTVLDYLIDDDRVPNNINRNLMQLINDQNLSFKNEIEKARIPQEEQDLEEIVSNLTGSPAIKKGILQSLKIVDELVEIMGYPPKNVIVEMARENQTTSQGIKNSRPRLKALEEAIKDIEDNVLKKYPTTNQALRDDRLYLYYLQNGKDMYTGRDLDLNNLSNYDIDHIIPRSFTTDNSINNRVLVSSQSNRGKLDDVPSEEVVKKQENYWRTLRKSGLMSDQKFKNLTKIRTGGLKPEDKEGFIKRQLVETRQIIKHVAQILDQRFNMDEKQKNVKIITLKSSLVSQFRQQFNIYKIREVNDYHHAHDAYLNGVVANTLLKVYPKLTPEFVYGDYSKGNLFKERTATAKKQFYTNIMHFFASETIISNEETGEILWDQKYLKTVKKVLDYRQMNIVKKVEIQTGSFSKESIKPKKEEKKLIRMKNNLDPEKYGGFSRPNIAYSVIIEYKKGKKEKVTKEFVGITIMLQKEFEENNRLFLEKLGYKEPIVKAKLPKYSLFELENGRRRLLASANETQKGNQMVLPNYLTTLLYHAKKSESNDIESLEYLEKHKEQFDDLMDYIEEFSNVFTLANTNVGKIKALYEDNRDENSKIIATSFVNLMKLNKMGAPSDFIFFDTNIPRKRYQSVAELLDGKVIYQSITGLYETHQRV